MEAWKFNLLFLSCCAAAYVIDDIKSKNIALLVEDGVRNCQNALLFLQRTEGRSNDTNYWFTTFNSSGISTDWIQSLNNEDTFFDRIKHLSCNIETLESNKSLLLFAVLHAAETLPKHGAIIVYSDSSKNQDSYLERSVLDAVLRKNISVYTLDEKPRALEKIRQYSGGKVLTVFQKLGNVSVILSKKNIFYETSFTFPVDYEITGIHVTIQPAATTEGTLTSPSGYRFPFSNQTASNLIRYSRGSVFENTDGTFEIHLNFSTAARPTVGVWTLKLKNDYDLYNLTVFAFSDIAAKAHLHATNNDALKDVMKLGVTGRISHITDITVLDSNGKAVLSNTSYKFDNQQKYVTENRDNVPDNKNEGINVEIDKHPNAKPFYALIRGKDVKGNIFQRLSNIFDKKDLYPIQTITVDIAVGSELIVTPGNRAEVYFVVTNQGTSALSIYFTCSDSSYILHRLSAFSKYLEPQGSTTVVLYLDTRSGYYQDEITFNVYSGSQTVQKKVLVDVGSSAADANPPQLDYKYTSDCTTVLPTQCSKGSWTLEVTAQDMETGLMQLNSDPRGLSFPTSYTSGTTNSVTGYYSDSCCNPSLQIFAVDRLNNKITKNVNAYHAYLSAALIAAIVLGILLFILLVIGSTVGIFRYMKSKESYDLPTYRGGGI